MDDMQLVNTTQNNGRLYADRPVLLADADSEHCARLCNLLDVIGLRVCVAPDGAKVVEMALGTEYSLILMCLDLPVLGGAAAAAILRASGCCTPIVALVGAGAEPVHQGVGYVFIATLSLPVSVSSITSLLERHLAAARVGSADFADLPEFPAMCAEFAQHLPLRLAQMEHAALASRWTELASVAHVLRGTATTFGHPEVSALAGQIEQAVNAADHILARQFLASLLTTRT